METSAHMELYGSEWAANYERMASAAIPGREGLYRICRAAFRGLPAAARVLVVGCGTGADLIPLARALPKASFVGVEPADDMLQVCAKRVAEEGLAPRVTLQAMPLDRYSSAPDFDAATSILVSQHLDDEKAAAFFAQIAALLKPNGRLYTADVHIGVGQDREQMLNLWSEQAVMSGIPAESIEAMRARFGTDAHLRDESAIAGFLAAAGFVDVLKPFSSLLYGAWTARKRPAA